VLNREVVIVGYSGHGYVVAEAAILSNRNLKYYLDKNFNNINPFNLTYLGYELDYDFNDIGKEFDYILGIGDNLIRKRASDFIIQKGMNLINVIHPSSLMSTKVQLGVGNYISKNVSLNFMVEIGDNCILNTGCIIEHECIIGNAVHVAPGAVVAGNVMIGDNTFVGANSIIKQGITIGANVVIGAGSVILKDIEDNSTVLGNPGKLKLV
jgi:sugar O-acyltransferase (sialic acid O-acetyltransferase NeuD family)